MNLPCHSTVGHGSIALQPSATSSLNKSHFWFPRKYFNTDWDEWPIGEHLDATTCTYSGGSTLRLCTAHCQLPYRKSWMESTFPLYGSPVVSPLYSSRKATRHYRVIVDPSPAYRRSTRSSPRFWGCRCGSICVRLIYWLLSKPAAHRDGVDAVISYL